MIGQKFDKLNKIRDRFLARPEAKFDICENSSGPITGLSTLYSPPTETHTSDELNVHDVAETLLGMGRLTPEELSTVRGEQLKDIGTDTIQILLKLGFADVEDILAARAHMYGFEFRHIKLEQIEPSAFGMLEPDFIIKNHILPISVEDGILTIATSEPENVFILDEVKNLTGLELNIIVSCTEDIEKICASLRGDSLDYDVNDLIQDISDDVEVVEESDKQTEDLEKMAGESPVIKFVNYLISHAIKENASDIHIEPKSKETKIRYRIDGVLFEDMNPPSHMHPAIVSRLKIMSNLDISERRLPQDGKIAVIVGGRGIDLRVSILPTTHGEKVVIRILDSQSILRGFDDSGMSKNLVSVFTQQIAQPNGILLVTGPTGSGKSTTLYSALANVDGKTLNVSTVEDPVEYELAFANQVSVNDRVGMTFSAALRSLLRQDPDIIMVGEIRDSETSKIAVQAALTGHLVLSTLHTNDAPSTITRLVNIGIEPYLIAASLNAVLAQRLVRKICPNCKEPYTAPENLKKQIDLTGLNSDHLFAGRGCDKCRNSGYSGRIGIYEFMLIDDQIKSIINSDCSAGAVRKAFIETGTPTLYQDGIAKVAAGLTTIEEILRVTDSLLQN
ncbi:MAG: Flp pilus assembly complex ATPase component TadA [Anaerohalosphaeraceae bacterium]|nr:Flp pilus assembly complex ATPase component TadA [Anaerohalosphaeraceae bacterium]